MSAHVEPVTDAMRGESRPEVDRQLLAHGIVGMAEATVRYWRTAAPDLPAERVIALLSEQAWAGLRGPRRHV